MKKLKLILLVIPFLFASSCNESTTDTIPAELVNTLWVLESFEVNGRINAPPSDQVYEIQFNEDNKFDGTNDCNTISGIYSLKLNIITMDSMATTKVYCGKESMDYRYLEALNGAKTYDIGRSELSIYYEINSKLNFVAN